MRIKLIPLLSILASSLFTKLVACLMLFAFVFPAKAHQNLEKPIQCASLHGATTIDARRCAYERQEKLHHLLGILLSSQLLDDWKRVASEVCSQPSNANHQREMRFYKLMVIQCQNDLSRELLRYLK